MRLNTDCSSKSRRSKILGAEDRGERADNVECDAMIAVMGLCYTYFLFLRQKRRTRDSFFAEWEKFSRDFLSVSFATRKSSGTIHKSIGTSFFPVKKLLTPFNYSMLYSLQSCSILPSCFLCFPRSPSLVSRVIYIFGGKDCNSLPPSAFLSIFWNASLLPKCILAHRLRWYVCSESQ